MDDKKCKELFIKENGKVRKFSTIKKLINENNELNEYLKKRFNDSLSIKETVYRIIDNIENAPVCICGKKLFFNDKTNKFPQYCCTKCNNSDPNKIKKVKQTKLEKYGDENYNNMEKQKSTLLEKYGQDCFMKTEEWKNKTIKTNKEKYGVEWALQNKEYRNKGNLTKITKYGNENYNNREKAKKTCQDRYGVNNPKQCDEVIKKMQKTCQDRYGVDSYTKTKECKAKIRETNLKRYGANNCTQNKEWVDKWYGNKEWVDKRTKKIYDTMLMNNSFKHSKPESIIFEFLKKYYPDVIYQYKDELYPFKCDFYIPSKKLYIEYNGFWHHGGHAFDENNPSDIEKLFLWKNKNTKMYNSAIKTWTIRDVEKLETFKNKNLNYIILWYEDFKKLNTIKEMVDKF